jgi:hypothetical protein
MFTKKEKDKFSVISPDNARIFLCGYQEVGFRRTKSVLSLSV